MGLTGSLMPSSLVGCSLLEQNIHRLKELTAENGRRLLKREDTALYYKRCRNELR